ncbi:MAG TPA: potassium-transporting ATPase subunit KdpA [Gemmataceae bacterium]|nr:potassium-transporting ATPase subunit KdpA [Gemmataceae bacterium]
MSVWLLPVLVVGATVVLAIPLGLYLAWILDGRYRPPTWLRWIEARVDTGPQNWKQYTLSLLYFNVAIFIFAFAVLALQPYLPLNPDGKTMLSPSTIFNTVCSFLSNTNLQHYSGEVHLSYFSQIFAIGWDQFVTPAVGLAALVAIIRGLRGDPNMGNFYLDLWRGVVYIFVPLALILALLLMNSGMPMTFEGAAQVQTVEAGAMGKEDNGQPKSQMVSRGPTAAIVAIKQLGTNGGGFFGANSCHPFENPTAWTNFLECISLFLIPIASLVMLGRMLNNFRHAVVIFGVMLVLSVTTIVWAVHFDTRQPNPALTGQAERTYQIATAEGGERTITVPAVPALPVNQALGNLEGKELRFGTSAGATWAALTTNTSNGSCNAMHDSLNPLAGLTPLTGMWLNCIWGGVGVGFINFFIYLIVGVFLAGLMVGRTPEYLGKKVEAREMKLAMLALLIHPLMILFPTGLFAALDWGTKSTNNPGPHGFSEILYEFTSASANNGSGFEGLGDTYGFNKAEENPSAPAPYAVYWDIACGLVMLISRFVPIIAPIAIAASLAAKKPTPFTAGTMRTDTLTFGFVLLGTILLVGALLFMPAAVLGPAAEHLGPIPFGQ